MNKKIIIGAIAIILIVVGTLVVLGIKEKRPFEVAPVPRPEVEGEQVVWAGFGWSQKENEREAAKEAVARMKTQLKGKTPNWLMIYSTIAYDSEMLLSEIRGLLGPEVKIHGGTSFEGVMNTKGWYSGKAITLLGISSEEIDFGVGGIEIGESGRAAGQKAIRAAIENTKKAEREKPKLILMTSAPGVEEEILLGIADVVGKEVPVIGGASGDNKLTGEWKQFANAQVYGNGLVLTALYTELKIGYHFSSGLGYLSTDKVGIVTKAKGRTIYTIDNRPAAEVYNEWLEGEIAGELELGTPGGLLFKGIMDPLVQLIKDERGVTHYLTIHPIQVNLPEKSLASLAVTKKGEMISIMHGTLESHLLRGPLVARMARAQGKIAEDEVAAGLFICCACTHMVLGKLPGFLEDNLGELIAGLNRVFGGAAFIGAFTFGEQGYVPGIGNRHQNLITNVVVFPKR